MSSRFSRRSTRVQHKPHVCRTPPPPGIPPQVWPATVDLQLDWSFNTLGAFQSVNMGPATGAHQGGGLYTVTGFDMLGNPFIFRLTITNGAPSYADIDVTGCDEPPPQLFNNGTAWDGTTPFAGVVNGQAFNPNISGSGTWPWTLN